MGGDKEGGESGEREPEDLNGYPGTITLVSREGAAKASSLASDLLESNKEKGRKREDFGGIYVEIEDFLGICPLSN